MENSLQVALRQFFTDNAREHRVHSAVCVHAVPVARAAAEARLDLADFAVLIEESWGEYIHDMQTFDDRLAQYPQTLEALLTAFCTVDAGPLQPRALTSSNRSSSPGQNQLR